MCVKTAISCVVSLSFTRYPCGITLYVSFVVFFYVFDIKLCLWWKFIFSTFSSLSLYIYFLFYFCISFNKMLVLIFTNTYTQHISLKNINSENDVILNNVWWRRKKKVIKYLIWLWWHSTWCTFPLYLFFPIFIPSNRKWSVWMYCVGLYLMNSFFIFPFYTANFHSKREKCND